MMREWLIRSNLKLVWIVTLLLATLCIWKSTEFVGASFAGFRTDIGAVVSANRADDWTSAFEFSDYITHVGGQPVRDRADLLARYAETPVGVELEHRGLRHGQPFVTKSMVRAFTWADWWHSNLPLLVFTFAFGGLGLFVAARQQARPEARIFSALCAAFVLAAVANLSADFYPLLLILCGIGGALVGSLPIVLAIRMGPWQRTTYWPVVLSLAFSVYAYWQLPDQTAAVMDLAVMERAWTVWWLAVVFWPLIGLLAFIGLMGYNLTKVDPNSLTARQGRIIFFGAVAAFLPMPLAWMPFLFGSSVDPVWGRLAMFGLVLFPLAISFAVLRYRLFEIELIIRRTLVYTALVLVLATVYLGGMSLSVHYLGAGQSEPVRLALFMLLALVFDPCRRWFQAIINRTFDRGRMTMTETQRLINRRAVEHRDTSQTLDGITRDVREALRLDGCALALLQEGTLWTVAGDSELIGTSLTVASLPNSDHWDRNSHPDFPWPDRIAACVKVTLRDRLVAVLLLGEKRSQEPLSSQDFDYLGMFLGQIGVLLSYTQVLDRQQAVDREMQKLLARVSELNDLRASFGIVASHELRTPLTVIQGHAEALMSGIFGNLDPEQQESVQSIFKSATSLSLQINAYLDLVALREKRLVLRAGSIDVGTLIHEVLAGWTAEIDGKGLQLRLEVEQAAKAYADARRVKQIIEQLISNAVKFTPKGGSVWIQAIADVACVKVQIRDSGPGIDMAKLDQAFDDFAQLEDATQRDHGGLGLGLPLAKGLAEMMGGWLAYSPAPGQGAVFTVALPLAQQPLEPPAHSRRLSLEFPDGMVTPRTTAEPKSPSTKHGLDMADVIYERADDLFD